MEKTHMHGAKESRNLMHGMKPSNAHSRVRKISLFLHGWRRYVCRKAQVTLIELNRDTKEIRARHQSKAQHQKPNQNNQPKTQTTKQPGSYLRRAVQAEAKDE